LLVQHECSKDVAVGQCADARALSTATHVADFCVLSLNAAETGMTLRKDD